MKKAFKLAVLGATVFLIISALGLYIFSEELIMTMTRDSQVILYSKKLLNLQCISLPLLGYFALASMLMQNIGQYFWSSLISVSRQGIFYIPLLYILTGAFGQVGIFLLQPVADFMSFILALVVVWKIGLGTRSKDMEYDKIKYNQ